MSTTPHGLRTLGLALFAGLVVCAPAKAHRDGHFGAVGHGGAGFHGGFGWWGWPGDGLLLGTLPLDCSTLR
jgi:hypothetical protein